MRAARGWLCLAAVMAGATLLQQAVARPGGSVPFQMSSSAILFYDSEYQPWYGQPISQCELLLNRAKEGGSRRCVTLGCLFLRSMAEGHARSFDSMPEHSVCFVISPPACPLHSMHETHGLTGRFPSSPTTSLPPTA